MSDYTHVDGYDASTSGRMDAALRVSAEKYRTLFESMDEGYLLADVLFDEDNRPVDIVFREANPAAKRITGLKDFKDRRLTEIDPSFESHWFEAFGRVARTGKGERNTFYADSLNVWYDFYIFRPQDTDSQRIAIVFQDNTDRKQTEQLLIEHKRLLELIASGKPLEECLSSLCAAVPRLNPGVRASILLTDDRRQFFQRVIAPDLLPSFGEGLAGTPTDEPSIGTCSEAVLRGESVACKDIANDDTWSAAWRDLCVAHGVLAGRSTPIPGVDGQPLGSFMLCLDAPRAPNQWEQRLADFGAHIASIALERDRSSQALRESEEKYRTLFESMDEGCCIIEKVEGDAGAPLDFRYIDVNPAFAAQSGVGNVVGKTIRQVVPGEPEEWFITYDTVLRTGKPIRFERELVTQGRVLELYAFRVDDGVKGRVGVIFTDITERKRRTARDQFLVELDRTLRPLDDPDEIVATAARLLGQHLGVDRCTYAEVEADEDHFFIRGGYVRSGMVHFVGRLTMSAFGAEALRLMRENRPYVVYDVDEDERITEAERPIYKATAIRAVVGMPLHKGGQLVAGLAVHQRAPRRWSPEEIKLVATVSNRCWEAIERARVTRELRESEERFRATFEQAASGMAHVAPDGTWLRTNRKLSEVLGYSREELSQLTFPQITHPDDRDHNINLGQKLLDGSIQTFSVEKRYIRKDGAVIWANLTSTLKRDQAGRPEYFISVTEDITDRKRTEEALRELNETLEERVAKRTAALVESEEKLRDMASRLTMAEQEERRRISKILHDNLQQQLYGIQMKLSFARWEIEAGTMDGALKNLAEADKWLGQGIEMTRQLTVDLSPPILEREGLADMLGWLVPQMQEMHGLKVALAANGPFRIPDEDMRVLLFQIVREILFNVVKHADADHATVELHDAGGRLVIRVTDDGCGFDVDKVTAREEPEIGFGLYSVRERLGLFDGRMEIESAPGEGTCVTLDVPLALA